MSFYVQLQFIFFLHCDEWDRFVAPPRHKFVTGATLLQLGVCVAKLSSSLLSVKQFTIGVEFEVNIKTWDRGSYFCRFLYLKSFGVYYWYTVSKIWIINWHNIINIPESKIKGFSFYICLSLIDVLETLSHRGKGEDRQGEVHSFFL